MKPNTFDFMKLETHETKDIDGKNINGELTVVWRD